MALDSNNYPHIAYTQWVMGNPHNKTDWSPRDGIDSLIYTSWNGETWTSQTVATDAAFEDLALDSLGNPHILYKDTYIGGLKYASWKDYNWQLQTIDPNGFSGSLALDSMGNPHIAYITNGNATNHFFLKYSSWTGSSWSTQIVDASSKGNTYSASLKLDAQNQPHIMYTVDTVSYNPYNSSETLKYATFHDNRWTIQTLGTNIEFANMVLDSSGYLHFTEGLTYASWNGATLVNQTVGSNNHSLSSDNSYLSLDKNNNPHIDFVSLSGSYDRSLAYASWNGSAWDIQTVTNVTESAGPIVIDSNGNPHICYSSQSGWVGAQPLLNIMYATSAASATNVQSLSWVAIPILAIVVIAVVLLLFVWKEKITNAKNIV